MTNDRMTDCLCGEYVKIHTKLPPRPSQFVKRSWWRERERERGGGGGERERENDREDSQTDLSWRGHSSFLFLMRIFLFRRDGGRKRLAGDKLREKNNCVVKQGET